MRWNMDRCSVIHGKFVWRTWFPDGENRGQRKLYLHYANDFLFSLYLQSTTNLCAAVRDVLYINHSLFIDWIIQRRDCSSLQLARLLRIISKKECLSVIYNTMDAINLRIGTFKNTKLASRKFLLSLSPPCIYGLRLRWFPSPNVIAVPSHSPTPIFPTVSRENQLSFYILLFHSLSLYIVFQRQLMPLIFFKCEEYG